MSRTLDNLKTNEQSDSEQSTHRRRAHATVKVPRISESRYRTELREKNLKIVKSLNEDKKQASY